MRAREKALQLSQSWHSKIGSLPCPHMKPTRVSGLNHATPLQILFTSGTTGDPKGPIVAYPRNVLASVWPIAQAARGYMRYERLVHPLRF